jgi:asparagine synthase (glutamine-hydrolysing)
MSAISGVIRFQPQEDSLATQLHQITERMLHRGNQDEGYVFFAGEAEISCSGKETPPAIKNACRLSDLSSVPKDAMMGFGHRLGSVSGIAEPAHHQPFQSKDHRFWIVLDGEILNAGQLAKMLREEKEDADEGNPAEIVALGYKIWQEKILTMIEGSFSFVLFDKKEQKIFGARDPFGVKPFYYAHSDSVFVFSSELKGLIGLPFISKKVSKSAVFDYLILGKADNNIQTMFRGLSELMPGNAFSMLLPKGNLKTWNYFHLITDSKIERYSRNKISTLAHRLNKSLANNIHLHLNKGIKTAYRIDSDIESLIFPFLLKESIREIQADERPRARHVYSGLFGTIEQIEGASQPELEFAEKITQELDIELLRSTCRFEDFSENLLKICYLQDLPFTSLEVFSQFKMLETARQSSIQVVIDSIGAEQLFCMNQTHLQQFLHDLLAKKNYSLFFENFFGASNSLSGKVGLLGNLVKKIIMKSTADDLKETLIKANQEEFSYLKDHFVDRYSKNIENNIKSIPQNLNQLLMAEFSGPGVREALRTSDRNAQFFNVEVRQPFVSDRDLADSMIKSNSIYKIRSGQTGNLLKKSLRGVFPDGLYENELLRKRKSQEINWLARAGEELKEYITPDLDDFIDSRKIKKDWDKLVQINDGTSRDFLWRVINLGIWRKVYFG